MDPKKYFGYPIAQTILYAVFIFLTITCKKEDIEYASFKNFNFPGLDNIVLNSYANDNNIIFSTYEGLFCFNEIIVPEKEWNLQYLVYHDPLSFHKMPVYNDYFVTLSSGSALDFRTIDSRGEGYTFHAERFDTAFVRFALVPSDKGITASINNNGYFAITYWQRPPNMSAVQMVLLICKPVWDIVGGNKKTIKDIEYTLAPLGNLNDRGDFKAIGCFKNDFIVSFYYGLNRVSQHGVVTDLSEGEEKMNHISFDEFFTFNESLYCLDAVVRKFDEDSERWWSHEYLDDIWSNIHKNTQFVQIDDYLVGYGNKIVIISNFESSNPSYSSKNTALINITSVNAFGDYIYVTTLNGVYYMLKEDFFKNK
jgi:hypothetical protein